ncbi:hypothetical protein DESAMIL20_631 [Desulfurella amilsii]|uniref:Uncharacterized protein n=1 Tax=Desulfurella amilsii TaxID=1562698 RepID=A0A1X4XYD5_9BACT|nr:hypothetical protein [Desulfurella amilsii]OSS42547.1 hypothetical protein DESAMIL20_631 [Desulfurella amilsii]
MLLQPVFKSKEALPIGRLGGLGERGCHCYLDHYKEFGKLCQKGGDDEKN